MLHRCHNEFDKDFKNYGGRGIVVCDRWRTSFENFLADVGRKPSPAHQIDRKDNDKGYEPGNVRWTTAVGNANNRRGNRTMTLNGRSMTIAQWAKELGCDRRMLWKRIKLGWTDEEALTVGFGQTKAAA